MKIYVHHHHGMKYMYEMYVWNICTSWCNTSFSYSMDNISTSSPSIFSLSCSLTTHFQLFSFLIFPSLSFIILIPLSHSLSHPSLEQKESGWMRWVVVWCNNENERGRDRKERERGKRGREESGNEESDPFVMEERFSNTIILTLMPSSF